MRCGKCNGLFENGEMVFLNSRTKEYLHHRCTSVPPVDELADPELEAHHRLQRKVEDLEQTIRALGEEARQRLATLHELTTEVERLRRENANMRAGAALDFEHANNWRRYVATVGEERASVYLVPPAKDRGH